MRTDEAMRMIAREKTASLRCSWDEYDAYLFDVDGTLLHCSDAVHYFAFCDALGNLAGRPLNLDGVTAHGNTDVGILRDALQLAGVPEEQWRPRLVEACVAMCRFVDQRAQELRVVVLPGVVEVLNHLRRRKAVLGVATGNLEQIGRAKLAACGLMDRFDVCGFSDLYEYRCDVFRGALERVGALAGAEAQVCVVGDTPHDVRAARANGLDVIAVVTGTYSYAQLQAETPNWCLHSLMELIPTPA